MSVGAQPGPPRRKSESLMIHDMKVGSRTGCVSLWPLLMERTGGKELGYVRMATHSISQANL